MIKRFIHLCGFIASAFVLAGLTVFPVTTNAGGTVSAEIVSSPSIIEYGARYSVVVKVKFSGDDNDGPWLLKHIALKNDLDGITSNNADSSNLKDTIKIQRLFVR